MRQAAILTTTLACFCFGTPAVQAEIAWKSNLRDAHAQAKQQGKSMLLHFYTDNCTFCDKLEAGAFRNPQVFQTINSNFVPVKVHAGKNPKLTEMFKVDRFPTDVVVTTTGQAISHSVSPQRPDQYIAMLSGAQTQYLQSQTMLAANGPAKNAAGEPSSGPAASQAGNAAATPKAEVAQMTLPGANAPVATDATTGKPDALSGAVSGQMKLPADAANPNNEEPVNASLASSRSRADAMGVPPQGDSAVDDRPELAIEGYCPVSVVKKGQWVEGKPELGVIHLGKLYLFADQTSMDLFLDDPVPFTPMLNEIDVVRFFEDKQIVPGKREWGLIDPVHNRMFFFADEAAMLHFEKSFERYLDAAIEVMDQAIEDANPGV